MSLGSKSWEKLDSGVLFRDDFESKTGYKVQLEYPGGTKRVTLSFSAPSSLRNGGLDSLVIYDKSDSENAVSTRFSFTGDGNLRDRIRTDYATGQGSVENAMMSEYELGLVKPLFVETDEHLLEVQKRLLGYSLGASHKPFKYVRDNLDL